MRVYNENRKPKTYDIGGTCKIVGAKVFEVQKFTFALQFTTHSVYSVCMYIRANGLKYYSILCGCGIRIDVCYVMLCDVV